MAVAPGSTGDLHVLSLEGRALIDAAGESLQPIVNEALRGQHIIEISGNYGRTIILTGEGSIQGSDPDEPLKALDGQLAQVAFGKDHSVALTRSGQVYTLGVGASGQLGHGGTASCAEPKLIAQISSRTVAQVACGAKHSLALTQEGDLFSWGAGSEGQLGLGVGKTHELVFTPRYVCGLQGTPVAQIGAGSHHSVALTAYKTVFTWGDATCGQLGLGKPLKAQFKPTQVMTLPEITLISCGNTHTAALGEDGSLYSWGLALRGPPLAAKMTGLPELLDYSKDKAIAQLACGGGSTVVVDVDGHAWCWPTKQKGLTMVPIPPDVCVSRIATGGDSALLFVETSVTEVSPACVPLRGTTELTLRGAGFFRSDAIVVRFAHQSGRQKLLRGSYVELDAGDGTIERIVRVEAPDLVEDGPGSVSVAISFEDGVGNTFTSQQGTVRYYMEPVLVAALPSCASISTPTPMLLRARDPAHLFAADSAHAFFFSRAGKLLAKVAATYVASPEVAMRVTTPLLDAPEDVASVRLAIDGQTAAPMGAGVRLYTTPSLSGSDPCCGPMAGGTTVTVLGSPLFASKEAVVKLVALPPPPPEPEPEPEPESEPSPAEEGDEATGAEAEAAPAEGEGEEKTEPPPPPPPPPPPQLAEGMTMLAPATFGRTGDLTFAMPALAGVGSLSLALAMNGVDFVAVPGQLDVYAELAVETLSPAVGSRSGGTVVRVHGPGVAHSRQLTVCFVKGAWRAEVPATFDAAAGCASCVTPPYGGAAKEGGDDDGDCIAEISLNGQQWTWSCKHFTYIADPEVEALDPPSGPIEGGAPLKLTGSGFRAAESLAVRFTRTELDINAACPESLTVEGTFADDGSVACETPVFEGADSPFDTNVQLTVDGQIFSPVTEATVFKFEAGGGKKKK